MKIEVTVEDIKADIMLLEMVAFALQVCNDKLYPITTSNFYDEVLMSNNEQLQNMVDGCRKRMKMKQKLINIPS